jgi:hypothetical protein
MRKVRPMGVGKLALALAVSFCPSVFCTGAFAQPANVPPRPLTRDQTVKDTAPEETHPARDRRSMDRPPPESGRPFIGPRTTQGLAEDAIARSRAR